MTLDRVNQRLFVPEPGNIRVLVYQLDEEGRHVRHTADHVVGHRSALGRRRNSEVNRRDAAGGAETGLAFDHRHERLFVRDRSRILVFDARPVTFSDYPQATHVLGQPDFATMETGGGAKHFPRGGELLIDDDNQRLFVEDRSRILVFDIDPERLENYPDAAAVIGQKDFEGREPGLGPDRVARTHGIAFDPEGQRLFVSDEGNQRILVFDVDPERDDNGPEAIAVFGQPDFHSNARRFLGGSATPEARRHVKSITPGGLDYDPVHKRLFVSQLVENRILVFDASPERLENDAEAIAVLGQPDFETFDPRVSRERFAFPKDPTFDADKQVLYVSEGFPGGNRVLAFDVRPESLRSGMPAMDVIGHLDDRGRDDFDRRMANDRIDAQASTMARAVALDPIGHRLWVADEYNNRVLGFQLDRDNRVLEREARWVFGQQNFGSARAERSASGINVPLAVAYDVVDARLYVGDGWNDRVLVFDVNPSTLPEGGGHEAIAVLGQSDFDTQEPGAARNRFDFAVDRGRGIASNMLPTGIAVDANNRRAFISDGGNNRVLVFDIHADRLRNGADAVAVIGQEDFLSSQPGTSSKRLDAPGHLAYDPEDDRLFVVDNRNHRVLGFVVTPEALAAGAEASLVIGQSDFTTSERKLSAQGLAFPNGVAYDPLRQHLYVADQGNDRVLAFDVDSQGLTSGAPAFAVFGQKDFETKSNQVLRDVSAQDQLYDPRGIDFDSEHSRLFVTDSHWARVLVFDSPTARRGVEIPKDGSYKLSSLDAILALDASERQRGYGVTRVAGAVATRISTVPFENELTEQHSRLLISRSASQAVSPQRRSVALLRDRSTVWLTNSSKFEARVELTRHTTGDSFQTPVVIPAGSIEAIEEVGRGTLVVASDQPLAVSAWSHVSNQYGEEVTTAMPVVSEGSPAATIPNLALGGGFSAELVLMNSGDDPIDGEVFLYDDEGRQVRQRRYDIAPGRHWSWDLADRRAVARGYYARVDGPASAAAIISRSDDGLITRTSFGPAPDIKHARVVVDTMRDLIRHGRSTEFVLVIANPDTAGASVRFFLRDLDGREVDRVEQLLMPRSQITVSLGSLFDRRRFAGTISLASDVAVAVSARQVTTNVRGEEILTELPVLQDTGSRRDLVLAYLDGEGEATQWFLVGDRTATDAAIELFGSNGSPMSVVLR